MHLTSLLTPLLLTYATLASADCAHTHPKAWTAINRFCRQTNLVVPSWNALKGASADGAVVNINGNCAPAQWIPQKYCLSQFRDMCRGRVESRAYGSGGCQTWRIHYVDQLKPQAPAAPKPAVPFVPQETVIHL